MKVSVVISVLNGAKYLSETLDSILNQTINNWECWIVNDGSKDDTQSIIDFYCRKDSRFLSEYTSGGKGPYAAANIAFPRCKGEYIARIDADDICLPQRFEKQIKILDSKKNINVCGSFSYRIIKGNLIKNYKYYNTSNDFLKWKLLFHNNIIHSTMMVRKSWFKSIGFYPNKRLSQDWYIWIESAYSKSLHIIEEPLIGFRVHADQISSKSINEQLKHGISVSKNAIKKFLDLDIDIKSIELIILSNKGLSTSKFENIKKSIIDLNHIREVFKKSNASNISTIYFYKTIFMIIKSNYSYNNSIKNMHLIFFVFKNNPYIVFYISYFLIKKLFRIKNI